MKGSAGGELEIGPMDVVFANAGILGSPGELWKYPEEQFLQTNRSIA